MRLAIGHADVVNLLRVHSGMNLTGHFIKHTRVDYTGPTNAFYLFFIKNQVAGRNLLTFVLPVHHLLVEFRQGLTGQTMPSFLLVKNHVKRFCLRSAKL